MHVLVTGGAGYIGSVTAKALLDAGHRVTVLDNLARGHREQVPAGASFVETDTGDRDAVARAVEGAEACVHLAAFIEVGESVSNPEMYFENNTTKAEGLIDTLIDAGVERFVFSSTAAVYGPPDEVPIPVTHARRPANPYGESKARVEDALAARADRLRSCVLRYFNAAGAIDGFGEDHRPESHLIPRVLDVALGRREAIEVFGTDWDTHDGTCIRDYIHVADLASAHVKALDALVTHPSITANVGTGTGFTVMEVIEACREVTGADIPVRTAPRREGDVVSLVADPGPARELLGWEPEQPDLHDIVASAWGWHRARMAGRGPA